MKREIPPLHEVAKLEYKYKFLYFLRDIGIRSAHKPAVEVWKNFIEIQEQLQVDGNDQSYG